MRSLQLIINHKETIIMKHVLLILFVSVMGVSTLFAQPTAMQSSVAYQKQNKQSAMIELPYSPEVVQKAIKENMLKKGIKEDKVKGFQVFKGARLNPSDAEVADLYFKVDRKSRKEANVSVVNMIVGRPNENVALRADSDPFKLDEGKTFLNELIPAVDAYNLEVGITQQDEVVKKSEKKLKNLQEEQGDLEKKIRNLQQRLEQNKKNQESQNVETEKQRAARDAMQSRRTVAP